MYSTPRRHCFFFFFFNDTATTEIYTLSLHDALPISIIFGVVPDATSEWNPEMAPHAMVMNANGNSLPANTRSEEHTSELQSRSDLVCRLLLEKKKKKQKKTLSITTNK